MRRKHEVVAGARVSVWDNGDRWADRYTVVYLDEVDERGRVPYLAMSAAPFSPQGVGMHGEMPIHLVQYEGRGGVFRKRIRFADLPTDCQKVVIQDLEGANG